METESSSIGIYEAGVYRPVWMMPTFMEHEALLHRASARHVWFIGFMMLLLVLFEWFDLVYEDVQECIQNFIRKRPLTPLKRRLEVFRSDSWPCPHHPAYDTLARLP